MANSAHYSAITFVIGGIIGALLLVALFDWALIIFSAIEGARLITGGIHLPSTGTTIILVVLALFGVMVQATMFRAAGRRLINAQCRKCRTPVKIIAMLRSSAAAMTSSSRTEPPG